MHQISKSTLNVISILFLLMMVSICFLVRGQSSLSTTYTTADAWDCAGGAGCAKSIGVLDGRNKVFTLRAAPTGTASVDVYLNGIRERIGADYILSGNTNQTLTFTSPPATDDTVDVRYRENVRANVLPQ